jgi:unsaturated rhamnogalacturonyl hydrolase
MEKRDSGKFCWTAVYLFAAVMMFVNACVAQSAAPATKPTTRPVATESAAAGDAPADPGPLATDVSPAITHAAIHHAAHKVADWELGHVEKTFNQQWTYAALYDGFLAASKVTGDQKYFDAMVRMGDGFDWKLVAARFPHADDMALGQSYMDMYLQSHDAKQMADVKAAMDKLVVLPEDPTKPLLWWWCDALFMAPPVLARTYAATGDKKYLDYMDYQWWLTTTLLYDSHEHLFYRDVRYLRQRQKNGQKVFWSRGNGWVMGALVKVLEEMPKDYPARPKYVAMFREMAAHVAAIQSKDGLWRAGLLDPDAYESPEVSGSAFFTYAIAYGINQGILDRAKYEPVVRKSWAGMTQHIYADGRLGSIQPIGAEPGAFMAGSSSVFGVGGFLLAASEMDHLAKQ